MPGGARVLDSTSAKQSRVVSVLARVRVHDLSLLLGAIAAAWLLASSHWIFTDTVVPWDAKNQFYAFFRFLASAFHEGYAPFWNPFHYGGHPSVADPQSLLFAPAFVLWALIDAAPSIRTFDLIVYVHLLIGGLSVGVLGWRAGWPASASLLAAVVFMFGGPASGRLQHTGIILSYALFPLALLLLQIAMQRRSLLAAISFGVVAAVLALGRNHEALLLCFVLVAALIWEVARADNVQRYLRERAPVMLTMGGVGALLLAVPLLLTIQFAALSNRPEVTLQSSLEGSMYPANLATLAIPNVFGSLQSTQDYWGPNHDTLPEVGATDKSFNYLFIGAAPTIVLVWFGLVGGLLMRRDYRLMSGVLLVASLYTVGRYSPLYSLAFSFVPGIDLFRRPIDGTFVLVAAIALLVGQLLAGYVRDGIPKAPTWRLVAVTGCALGVIGWAVLFSLRSDRALASLAEVAKVAPIALLVIVLLARARTGDARALAAGIIALIAAGELLWFNTASTLNAEAPGYYAVLQKPTGEEARALAILEEELASRHQEGARPRIEVVGVSGSWQNLSVVRGLEATNGYNPLRLGSYDRLVSPGETTHIVDQRLFPASFSGYDCALARELGLAYVVLGRPIEEVPHLARRPVAEVLLEGPKVWIYRLRGAEPRVKFISRIVVADTDAQTKAGTYAVNPANETAIVDDELKLPHYYWPTSGEHVPSQARIISWRPDRVQVVVDSTYPGLLILHEAYYPGWVAEVDGKPARIVRTNVLFRGVEVADGRHVVEFRFEPFSLSNLRAAALGLVE
jgi:hypothetical protein